jgi:uncharacterized membrane protein YheB (UPF0754 family)
MFRLITATTMLLLVHHILLNPAAQVAAFHHANIRIQRPACRISRTKVTSSAVTHRTLPEIVFPKSQQLRELPTFIRSKKKGILLAGALLVSTRGILSILSASPGKIIQQTFQKFLLSWKMYSLIPFVAAFVGWITNYLAVQMIFFPIQWRGIPIKRKEGNPLGLLGWQGIIPAKTAKMSDAMVNVTINELLSMEETIKRLDPDQVADILAPQVPAMVKHILDDDETSSSLSPALRNAAKDLIDNNNMVGKRMLQDWLGRSFLKKLTTDMQGDILNLFNVRNCVVNQMVSDRSLLGKLFQMTGGKELKFLTDSGLWFGFLLGILQMFVALFCENPWTLSIGGLIVGLATNWIALKWIFEPIEPTKFGPFVLQGKFLRRQKEVAKDFSAFFAGNILNSNELWKSILNDPTTSPKFRKMFVTNLIDASKQATGGLLGGKPNEAAYLTAAGTKVTQRLPYHFSQTSFHSYVDDTLGIERTLRTGLESMSSRKFEQILHPIFQEDELTLILAGGVLGFLAGFGQQLLFTGVWSLPSLGMLFSFLRRIAPF